MTEISRREPENPRREAEMYRVEAIQEEMASAVRVLGGDGSAKEQITRAARAARLPHTTIERLRWRKIKRVPADLADAIREALAKHNEETLSRAKHELFIAQTEAEALRRRLEQIDPGYGRSFPLVDRRQDTGARRDADFQG
ncbi:hypothetical protein [Aquamicrobium terrae]|uniref:KfrA N-terminal DNA-binding domain-containing protein n=1 Tax=Aquamicrobium terrae TaxID=1324945 RepID=A0ABV2MV43_9HYPH